MVDSFPPFNFHPFAFYLQFPSRSMCTLHFACVLSTTTTTNYWTIRVRISAGCIRKLNQIHREEEQKTAIIVKIYLYIFRRMNLGYPDCQDRSGLEVSIVSQGRPLRIWNIICSRIQAQLYMYILLSHRRDHPEKPNFIIFQLPNNFNRIFFSFCLII